MWGGDGEAYLDALWMSAEAFEAVKENLSECDAKKPVSKNSSIHCSVTLRSCSSLANDFSKFQSKLRNFF
ncbi:hypothetical protein VNO78_08049 [Psophocarpus tetragonolobus]|uniref:Uncharacterized protein n=1 Tax=Psophocarpus tetragonolobus TaxID=3891 RepID=A0AAN9SVB8_PSOTE